MPSSSAFKFIDLFAGIGGFHAVGSAFNGECVLAAETDKFAAKIYESYWGISAEADVRTLAKNPNDRVPDHDVLFAGFPCQPFSKSGKQLGVTEDRGNLFLSIVEIVRAKQPQLIVLENVRNLAGPKHVETLATIVDLLRKEGYWLSDRPVITSPHRLSPEEGGLPQHRDRVYILAVRSSMLVSPPETPYFNSEDFHTSITPWSGDDWDLYNILPKVDDAEDPSLKLSETDMEVLKIWQEFREIFPKHGKAGISGFPIWADYFGEEREEEQDYPPWKRSFVRKNRDLYSLNRKAIDTWFAKHSNLEALKPSHRKFEWQAQDLDSISNGIVQFRPSGVRVKKATYVPALVAITQTSILPKMNRRLSPLEAAYLQGFPDNWSFGTQEFSQSYKQVGNAINVKTVVLVMQKYAQHISDYLKPQDRKIFESLLSPNVQQDQPN